MNDTTFISRLEDLMKGKPTDLDTCEKLAKHINQCKSLKILGTCLTNLSKTKSTQSSVNNNYACAWVHLEERSAYLLVEWMSKLLKVEKSPDNLENLFISFKVILAKHVTTKYMLGKVYSLFLRDPWGVHYNLVDQKSKQQFVEFKEFLFRCEKKLMALRKYEHNPLTLEDPYSK